MLMEGGRLDGRDITNAKRGLSRSTGIGEAMVDSSISSATSTAQGDCHTCTGLDADENGIENRCCATGGISVDLATVGENHYAKVPVTIDAVVKMPSERDERRCT